MPHDSSTSLRSFLAGGFGGICDVLVAYPFDLVTVRLQTAPAGTYSGPIDVARRAIAAQGGLRGLYHGASAPLLGVAPMFALSFWAYDLGQQLVRSFTPSSAAATTHPLSLSQISIAGAISSAPFIFVGIPFDRAKIILNLQAQAVSRGPQPVYTGFFNVLATIARSHGIAELYRGFGITVLRDVPAGAAYFVTYEGLKRALGASDPSTTPGSPKWHIYMLAGSAAHVAMVGSVFPLDTLKTRIQGAEPAVPLWQMARQLWKAGGIRAFYPGVAPAVIREVPAGAITFLGYEVAMSALGGGSLAED